MCKTRDTTDSKVGERNDSNKKVLADVRDERVDEWQSGLRKALQT